MNSTPHPPSPDVSKSREPQLLRFHLRHLFIMVTLFSVLCAVLVTAEGPWPLVVVSAVFLVGAHVLGNLIGTRLRDSSREVSHWLSSQPEGHKELPRVTTRPLDQVKADLPPSTPLASKQRVARWTYWFVGMGASIGLIAGGAAVGSLSSHEMTWAGWLVGVISAGILGAWIAFLASTFSAIARHAWRHADEGSS